MRLISYDCEVFAYDWLVTLKDKETGVYTCIWNDNEALKMALSDDCIYVGFNSKHYDQYIIKAIAARGPEKDRAKFRAMDADQPSAFIDDLYGQIAGGEIGGRQRSRIRRRHVRRKPLPP